MKFGFHAAHESLRERFSFDRRIYGVLLGVFSALIVFATATTIQPHLSSFAQDSTLNPLPNNYSAPFSDAVPKPRPGKRVIGFLPSWNIAIQSKVYPEYLDQIIYFGVPINEKGNLVKVDENGKPLPDWSYLSSSYFNEVRARSKETNTKILVTIKNFDSGDINTIISNPESTKTAVEEIIKLIDDYNLDGIDINFEYFSESDFPTMAHLNRFLTTLNTEVKKDHPSAILSFDVNATVIYTHNAYDMVKIGEQMDQVIIMGYDYYRPASGTAGPIAPTYESGDKPNVSKSLTSVLGRIPKEKIILGIPLYGYEWQTYTDEYGSRTVPDTGATATYRRIRDLIENRHDVSIAYDPITKSPWLVYKQNGLIKQIHYEDERSMLEKINLVYDKDIAGIAFWALGYEGDYIEPWELVVEHVRAKK